jgi:hypothetical protein
MERRESTTWLGWVAALLAATCGVSCGTGIRDGRGEVFTTETMGTSIGRIELKEAVLDYWEGTVAEPSSITLRRYDEIERAGAVGPVFELELPSPGVLQKDPRLGIRTSAEVKGNDRATIGFVSPSTGEWIPDSTNSRQDGCPELAICGPVQILSFATPSGNSDTRNAPTPVLRLAIVMRCAALADCDHNQTCTAGACQQCIDFSPYTCNP